MAPEDTFNTTADIHPCYEINKVSYALTSTPSIICVSLYVFLFSLSVVTICGNLLVIIAIIYFKQLHTPTNYLVLSLAVTDLLVGVLVFPFNMAFTVTFCWYDENVFCKIRGTFDMLLSTCSIMNLCCISVDRYYAVCQPLTYRTKINDHVAAVMILMSWGFSAVFAVAFSVAQLYYETSAVLFLMGKIIGPLFSFYLPLVIMLCIYLNILIVAQRQARSIQSTTFQSTKSGATVNKMERKATKTLAIVMGVFLISWAPFFLCYTFQLVSFGGVPIYVIESLNWLTLSNSMFNPFIYALFYSWFRTAFRMIISGKIFQEDFSNTKLF
ncbi:trace amine-associated receptor 1-like [Anabas testudineus]|uniref:trace amine-associated receptor 1-like n=1 Tax=Anabas testudineus TaxID=64144 RepID=UPI000E462A61|nr:trace amine-associated receptor 1-like [Anabas testudineus]